MSLIKRLPITIYTRHTNTLTGIITTVRRVLTQTVYTDQKADILLRTGTVPEQAVSIQVFLQDDLKYIPFDEWRRLPLDELSKLYTLETGGRTNTIVFLGKTDHEFTAGNQGQVTNAETAFIQNNANAFRIADFQDNITFAPTEKSAHLLIRGGKI